MLLATRSPAARLVLSEITNRGAASIRELAERINTSTTTVQAATAALIKEGALHRIRTGKRFIYYIDAPPTPAKQAHAARVATQQPPTTDVPMNEHPLLFWGVSVPRASLSSKLAES